MTRLVDFKFDTLQVVVILAIQVKGTVFARMANPAGPHEYQVCYWYEGERRLQWLYEHEIE